MLTSLHQLQLIYGEEDAAMDVDSDNVPVLHLSPPDPGAGTNPDVNVNKCLPLAREESPVAMAVDSGTFDGKSSMTVLSYSDAASSPDVNVNKCLPVAKEESAVAVAVDSGTFDGKSSMTVQCYSDAASSPNVSDDECLPVAEVEYCLQHSSSASSPDVSDDERLHSSSGSSPDVSDDDLLPVAEECCGQEEEEDASSVCSIEYHYSEEDYYQSGDDLDEDFGDKEVGMTKNKEIVSERSTEIVSITDLALKYGYKLLSDSETEHEKGLWHRISDPVKEDYSPPKSRPVCLSPVRKDLVYRPQCRQKPPLGHQYEIWVNSWEVKNHPTRYAWVNVYAHYNKNKGYGGYGVILRDWHAKPVTASAMYSSDAKSFFTQVLMGVKAGVILAEKHGISELCVESNSIKLPSLVNLLWNCRSVKCRDGTGICKGCLGSFFGCKGSDPSLVSLAREIKARAPKGQDLDDLLGDPRSLNKAARYLAKMEKKKAAKMEKKKAAKMEKKKAEIQPDIGDEGGMVPPGDEWPAEIQPGDFPEKLKAMLFEQAFGMMDCNDLSGW